uniref:40S ribosomal protein S8 n=1 Tax=Pleurostomum flabellatum TaxID=405751 RepID=A0A7T0Q4U8_9EUKA|nr:40S ribosomal protein S8 [Pleurostomum flabellatum]QPL15622.1 40S ribosomal protein S8 [Pleurostomum flabellatum]
MVKIQIPKSYFSSLISSIKNCIAKGKNKFVSHYSRFNSMICEYMLKNFFFSEVYYLVSLKNKIYFIFVVIGNFDGNLLLNDIKNFYKPSKPIYLKVFQIKKFFKKSKSVFLLSTSEGIVNSLEALDLRVGGLLLFEYY